MNSYSISEQYVAPTLTRRAALQRAGCGFGFLGLTAMLHEQGLVSASADELGQRALDPLGTQPPHGTAKATRVIWIFVNGGPSQVDTWDYKPALEKLHDKSIKTVHPNFKNTTGFFKNQVGSLMKSPFSFTPRGKCGKKISSIFPHLGQHADRMAFIHSGYTESNNHSPALFMMNSGRPQMGLPCLGSWVTYGLGSESRDLPAFIVMSDPKGRGLPKGHSGSWSAGFLPGVYQGTHLKPQGQPINNLVRSPEASSVSQRQQLGFLQRLNRLHKERFRTRELEARIESFELAYRMQSAAPEAIDIQREPEHVQRLYGMNDARCSHFAKQCLVARRLIERGVRFVQIYSGGNENQRSWDGHIDIQGNHSQFAAETDQPVAGLISDLNQRGLLDETLIVWCGEFGRLPVAQTGAKPGRDHNPHCFTAWLAGGGVRGGVSYGESDDVGLRAAVNRTHVNDLHATILRLLGINHKQLTYKYNGREFRLTDVAGNVIREILS